MGGVGNRRPVQLRTEAQELNRASRRSHHLQASPRRRRSSGHMAHATGQFDIERRSPRRHPDSPFRRRRDPRSGVGTTDGARPSRKRECPVTRFDWDSAHIRAIRQEHRYCRSDQHRSWPRPGPITEVQGRSIRRMSYSCRGPGQKVDGQGRRPGEPVAAQPVPGDGVVVLPESVLGDQIESRGT